jgi:anthranilate synthase component 1
MGAPALRLLSRELPLPAGVLLRLAATLPARYPVLFDSASDGPLARHSVLVAGTGAALWLDRDGRPGACGEARPHLPGAGGFLDALERWWRAASGERPLADADAPWCGGFAVFAGYELASEVEPTLRLPAADLPYRAFALRVDGALVFDHARGRLRALAEPGAAGEARLAQLEADAIAASRCGDSTPGDGSRPATSATPATSAADPADFGLEALREDDPGQFLERVARIQELIRAGELYQANLSRGWQARLRPGSSAAAIYRRLRSVNPAPFAVWSQWGGVDILSSSPERLVRVAQHRVSTRPIAGTRPRVAGRDDADPAARAEAIRRDSAAATALVAHPKERAEHVMLIDLERNDLGRICVAGSVEVRDFMTVETYAHVHHIVSEVTGRLRDDVSPVAALRAVFPGGTITGCPKVRCMQVIGQLEERGRGAYTGSIGMLGLDGSADFNILIRTLTVVGDVVSLRAGAGIVADSLPVRELEETRAKARGVLAALGVAA